MNPTIYLTLILILLPVFIILTRKTSKKLPPGSLGLPIIGQSLSFLRALQTDTAEKWFQDRIRKYGPVSKLSLFGTPTVFLHGQAANKLVYTFDGNTLANQQPPSIRRICGEKNITELRGDEHKRVRDALVSFLKPEVLKQYVGKMDGEIRKHLDMHWHGKQKVTVMPLMKALTFDIMSSLIFGIEQGATRNALVELFEHMMDGLVSIPINLPFTQFNRSLNASAKVRTMITNLIHVKRAALKQNTALLRQDFITCLLDIQSKGNSIVISDEEIVDNSIIVMIAGHDTSATLLTFLVRLLASDPSVRANIVQEQEEIARNKASGEHLTWDDIGKMKYTWRVALETLRMDPPLLGSFRRALRDIEYQGYTIPKGWQVMLASSVTHMDEQLFPDPSKFDPARFEKQAPPFSFVAFGGGPRICPGYEFARIETLATIHYLVTQFTWKLCCNDNSFSRKPFPVFRQGLPIEIDPKKL
ncbi:hypothetical protein Q3G72_005206 [Acer saccharum]|nr:hypothetical protein Q3G72_005206 [Acer saccharum]